VERAAKKNGAAGKGPPTSPWAEPQVPGLDGSSDEWVAQLIRLQDALTLCPADILTRCDLAAMLERLEQHEEALFHWKAVLACDPNSLTAREGVARCRRRTGQPLQPNM
jgi:cytochrome c-type biogenesis protein CcmH/NrfG